MHSLTVHSKGVAGGGLAGTGAGTAAGAGAAGAAPPRPLNSAAAILCFSLTTSDAKFFWPCSETGQQVPILYQHVLRLKHAETMELLVMVARLLLLKFSVSF